MDTLFMNTGNSNNAKIPYSFRYSFRIVSGKTYKFSTIFQLHWNLSGTPPSLTPS